MLGRRELFKRAMFGIVTASLSKHDLSNEVRTAVPTSPKNVLADPRMPSLDASCDIWEKKHRLIDVILNEGFDASSNNLKDVPSRIGDRKSWSNAFKIHLTRKEAIEREAVIRQIRENDDLATQLFDKFIK